MDESFHQQPYNTDWYKHTKPYSTFDDQREFPYRGENDVIRQNKSIPLNEDIELSATRFDRLIHDLTQEYLAEYTGDATKPNIRKLNEALQTIVINLLISSNHECTVIQMENCKPVFKQVIAWMKGRYLHFNEGNNLKKLLSFAGMSDCLNNKCCNYGVSIADIQWKSKLTPHSVNFAEEKKPNKINIKKIDIDAETPTAQDFKEFFRVTGLTNELYRHHKVKLALRPVEKGLSNTTVAPPLLRRIASDATISSRGRIRIHRLGLRHYARPFRFTKEKQDLNTIKVSKARKFEGNEFTSQLHYTGVQYQYLSGEVGAPFSRSRLLINGIPAAELDFSCMFPRIIYSELGIDTSEQDIYRCGNYSDEEWKSIYRPIYKDGFNILMNSKDDGAFKKGLRKSFTDEEYKISTNDLPVDKVLSDLLEAHPLLLEKGYFYGGRTKCLENMYLESQIVEKVLEQYIQLDKVVLPMFDGFIVQNEGDNIEELELIMRESYESVVGNSNCEIKREY